MKKEIRIFLAAVMFFTRIPCPKRIDHLEEYLNKSSRYFPLVGIIVGIIGSMVFYFGAFIFPRPIAIIISMIATILITGAFHEDGLADTCDGFGGGWTRESILTIMKDSRIGTFGVVGLISVLGLKFACLMTVDPRMFSVVLISGHALSRFAASSLLLNLEYARDDDNSKARPAAMRMSLFSLIVAAFWGIIPLFFFKNYCAFFLLIPVFTVRTYLVCFFKKWINGQTGDCLGATQQICEVIFYLGFVALWKFI